MKNNKEESREQDQSSKTVNKKANNQREKKTGDQIGGCSALCKATLKACRSEASSPTPRCCLCKTNNNNWTLAGLSLFIDILNKHLSEEHAVGLNGNAQSQEDTEKFSALLCPKLSPSL